MRFGASRRLRKGSEFERVFKEGTAIGGPFFVVRHVANGEGHIRWGFAVGKKAVPLAVDRNRMKRRLKAVAHDLRATGAADIIIVARPAALGTAHGQLRSELVKQLRRAGCEVKA